MFAIRPGAVGPLRSLSECLRVLHEDAAESRAKDIAERTKRRSLPSEDTNWPALAPRALRLSKAVEQCDAGVIRDEALSLLAEVSPPLEPIEPYEADADLDGVMVRIRAMSQDHEVRWLGAMRAATYEGTEPELVAASVVQTNETSRRYVAETIAEVTGLIDDDGPIEIVAGPDGCLPPDAMAVLDASGLVPAMLQVARGMQRLRPTRRRHYGLPPQSTSATSVAIGASSVCASPSGATATSLASRTTQAQSTSLEPARGASSSTMDSSPPLTGPSISTASPTEASAGSMA